MEDPRDVKMVCPTTPPLRCAPPFEPQYELVKTPSYTPVVEDLSKDFSMKDLNDIHQHLWMVGSRDNISPLHHQRVLLRTIIPSERSRLHLVWFNRTIYIKPLPDYLLNAQYYADVVCDNEDLYKLIVAFLRSYCSLIQFPTDLEIARDIYLLSKNVTWEQWADFRQAVLNKTNSHDINSRFQYGELRLHRLDLIYRFTGRGITYFTVHRTYTTYLQEYFTLFAAAFGFVAVILTAMQVLVSIDPVPPALLTVCYRFSVTVLVLICVCFGYVGSIFLSLFLYNYIVTLFAHV